MPKPPSFLGKTLIDTNGKNHSQKILTLRKFQCHHCKAHPSCTTFSEPTDIHPMPFTVQISITLLPGLKHSTLGVGEQGVVPEFQDGCKGISTSLMFLVNFH